MTDQLLVVWHVPLIVQSSIAPLFFPIHLPVCVVKTPKQPILVVCIKKKYVTTRIMSPFLAGILKERKLDPSSSTASTLVTQNFEK